MDGKARIAELLAYALKGTRQEDESAARAFYDGEGGRPLQDEEFLLRPLSHNGHAEFVRRSDEPADAPLLMEQRRLPGEPGSLSVVHSHAAYMTQQRAFTRGGLDGLDWSGIVLAGGGCLGPLLPLPADLRSKAYGESLELDATRIRSYKARWATIGYYNGGNNTVTVYDGGDHAPDGDPCMLPWSMERKANRRNSFFAKADLDLFLVGLTEDAAKNKIRSIGKALRRNGGVKRVVRTANAITFVRSWPLRDVQVILRLYQNVSHLLALFDIDCCACCFDGKEVLCLPRCRLALNSAANIVDSSRESPSFDMRLLKYALRGFAVRIPGWNGDSILLSEIEKPRREVGGLVRLLKLTSSFENELKALREEAPPSPCRLPSDESVEKILEALDGDRPLIGDQYGDTVFGYYVDWMATGKSDNDNSVLAAILCKMPEERPRFYSFGHFMMSLKNPGGYAFTSPLVVRDILLPWLFSDSRGDSAVETILDATDQELIAFNYKWTAFPPGYVKPGYGAQTCVPFHTVHEVNVLYKTSVPLLCRILPATSGNFLHTPSTISARPPFFHGMMPMRPSASPK